MVLRLSPNAGDKYRLCDLSLLGSHYEETSSKRRLRRSKNREEERQDGEERGAMAPRKKRYR
jgi:hypothetical protein